MKFITTKDVLTCYFCLHTILYYTQLAIDNYFNIIENKSTYDVSYGAKPRISFMKRN